MEGLIHMKVVQLPHHAGQVPVIHHSRRSIGTLSADQLGFFETHDTLTRDFPHKQAASSDTGRTWAKCFVLSSRNCIRRNNGTYSTHALQHPQSTRSRSGQPEGALRASDLDAISAPWVVLTRLTAAGLLDKIGRGLYRLPDHPGSEDEGLAAVATNVPQAVFCLLTALPPASLSP